eukprot:gene11510-14095_t
MENLLTDRAFWVNYWEQKPDLSVNIPANYMFHEQLQKIIKTQQVQTAIELGGFPGYYAVFLKKYFDLDVTLLDYFVHPPITAKLLKENGLEEKDIQIIETDLFQYKPEKQYDLVLSFGLIEHFNDTADIINRHINFVKPGGTLFITLPNFRALNGWFQKRFDPDNYDKHNINCMDPKLLAGICEQAGLEVIQSRFFGYFSLWLHEEEQKPLMLRSKKSLIVAWSWGYSPKIEKFIPLGEFPADRYLIIVKKVIENLGWKLSSVSASGVIAYTGLSFQSYSEEISVRITAGFAIFKSECIGIQLLFNDYGKNEQNLEKFFNEFEYVQYHLKDHWEEELHAFSLLEGRQGDPGLESPALAAKDKIKNIFYLFYPRKGYFVTPLIVDLNILFWFFCAFFSVIYLGLYQQGKIKGAGGAPDFESLYHFFGANSREQFIKGQWWRLLSQQFVHFSFWHLFSNMYALIYIGLMVENKLGSLKTLCIYLLSGICAGVLSLVYHKTGVMGGASGAILGMFGAFLALLLSKAFERNAARALLISTMILVSYMLLNGWIKNKVDNAAHIGGLISGFLLGLLFFRDRFFGRPVPLLLRYSLGVLLVGGTVAVSVLMIPRYQIKAFETLQREYLSNWIDFNQVYRIERDFPKEKKLKIIRESGLEKWKENVRLVKKMNRLLLDDQQVLQREYDGKIAEKGLRLAKLMYEQSEKGSPVFKMEIGKLMMDIEKLKTELAEKQEQLK